MGRSYNDETDNLLNELNSSLGRQISNELDDRNRMLSSHKKNERVTGRSTVGGYNSRENYNSKKAYGNGGMGMRKRKQKKNSAIMKIVAVASVVVATIALAVIFFSNYALDQINYEPDETIVVDTDGKETVIEDIVPSSKDIINILLIGEEAMADADRGRSDVMMVLTINQKYDRLIITSFLRDSYVTPPGYSYGSKMNEVYKKGGPALLVNTIEHSFQIQIDGYARVNFQSFEDIIDLLGGVEIELTEQEAKYLNKTNYISNKKYRNVVAGVQTLNGNQALGYSRVRYVKGITGERDDFGRTNRQRIVINAIFNKYKSKGLFELVGVTNKILPHVTTNMTKKDILSYLSCAAGMLGKTELETFRVPMDNAYSGQKVNGKSVLVINFERVKAALQEEMYGTGYSKENDTAGASWVPQVNSSTNSSSSSSSTSTNKGTTSSSSSNNQGNSTTSSNMGTNANIGTNINTGSNTGTETGVILGDEGSTGDGTILGGEGSIEDGTVSEDDVNIGDETVPEGDVSIGDGTVSEDDVNIGDETVPEGDVSIGDGTTSEGNVSTGDGTTSEDNTNTGSEPTIGTDTDTSIKTEPSTGTTSEPTTGSNTSSGADTNTGNNASSGTDTNTAPSTETNTETSANTGAETTGGTDTSPQSNPTTGTDIVIQSEETTKMDSTPSSKPEPTIESETNSGTASEENTNTSSNTTVENKVVTESTTSKVLENIQENDSTSSETESLDSTSSPE